jgi:hypothetical protein
VPVTPIISRCFINPVAADESLNENDPDGAAFDYEVLK